MSKDEEYLRDFMAMFAMLGLIGKNLPDDEFVSVRAYEMADAMMSARAITPDREGIAAIKPRKKYDRKNAS